MKRYFIIMILAALPLPLSAQRLAISTNALDYANFLTLNAELSYAVSQHWSIGAGAKYNPFTFSEGTSKQIQNRQRSASVGARWWPWHTWSGWWLGGRLQYREYNSGGVTSKRTEEGDSFGGGLSAGYSYMLGTHFNIELGAGAWAGVRYYTVYECPTCGITENSGHRAFVMPNDLVLSLSYVF